MENEYRLTKEDCLKIQGFSSEFKLCGNNKDQWKQLGNTIPTIFTEIIGLNLKKYLQVIIFLCIFSLNLIDDG